VTGPVRVRAVLSTPVSIRLSVRMLLELSETVAVAVSFGRHDEEVSPSAHMWPEKFPVVLATIFPVIKPPESAVHALPRSAVYVPFSKVLPSPLRVPLTVNLLPFSVNVNCTGESVDVTEPLRLLSPGPLWQGPPNSVMFRVFGARDTKEI